MIYIKLYFFTVNQFQIVTGIKSSVTQSYQYFQRTKLTNNATLVIPVLNVIGKFATGIVAGHKIYQGISDPQHHWFDFIEGTAIVVVAIAAPELVLGVSIGSTIIDFFRKKINI